MPDPDALHAEVIRNPEPDEPRLAYADAITPGLSFSIGYQPYRLTLVHAVEELLAHLARNANVIASPRLKHAVQLATKEATVERTIAAKRANELIVRAKARDVVLPSLPATAEDWPAWIAELADHTRRMLSSDDAVRGFDTGLAASSLMQAWGLAEKLAYLRASDPVQPDLADAATRNAATIPRLAQQLEGQLAGIDRPFVGRKLAWLRQAFRRAPRPDLTASKTYSSAYAEIGNWRKHLDGLLNNLDRDLDVPVDPSPVCAPTPEEQQLFGEILERPDDLSLRRQYAELAAKRRDPRAELIREQLAILELESRGELLLGRHPERVQELLVSHPGWTEPLRDLGAYDFQFDLGFPYEITIEVGQFLDNASALFARAPITSVRLRGGLHGRGNELAAVPQLAKVTALDLYEQGVTDPDVLALSASPHVSRLRYLNLGRNHLTDAGIESLVASDNLSALERVSLELNPGRDPVDQLQYWDETHEVAVPTGAGRALEEKYGPRPWFHPHRSSRWL